MPTADGTLIQSKGNSLKKRSTVWTKVYLGRGDRCAEASAGIERRPGHDAGPAGPTAPSVANGVFKV